MNQLESTIKAEKKKQLNNMRANMLNRRIAKEKKRKQAEEEIERIQKKQQILKFNSKMAIAFRKMVKEKEKAIGVQIEEKENRLAAQDRLRARLAAWEKKTKQAYNNRGGIDGEIWNLEAQAEDDREEQKRLKEEAELARINKEKNIQHTNSELYKRIVKIEKLADRIKESGIMSKQLSAIGNTYQGILSNRNAGVLDSRILGTRNDTVGTRDGGRMDTGESEN